MDKLVRFFDELCSKRDHKLARKAKLFAKAYRDKKSRDRQEEIKRERMQFWCITSEEEYQKRFGNR